MAAAGRGRGVTQYASGVALMAAAEGRTAADKRGAAMSDEMDEM